MKFIDLVKGSFFYRKDKDYNQNLFIKELKKILRYLNIGYKDTCCGDVFIPTDLPGIDCDSLSACLTNTLIRPGVNLIQSNVAGVLSNTVPIVNSVLISLDSSGNISVTVNGVTSNTINVCALTCPTTPPTTTVNSPTSGILPSPTNNDSGCSGGFISQEVTITGGGLNFTITSFPADLVTLLCNQVHDGTATFINSTVTTACGTAVDTLELNLRVQKLVQGGIITEVDGVACQLPPSTTINPLIGSVLPAPTNSDGGCAGGFVSETYDIYGFDGGGYVSIALFPVDLCDPLVFNGLTVPVGTTSLTITSTVTTNCGSDTDNYILAITESGGVVTGVNGVSCQLPPTTTINPISGTILPSPTNNDMGCTGGFIDEKLRINWDGLFIDLPINGAPYDLCDYLLGQPINVLEPTPMTINSSVTTDCGIDTDQINITVLQSGGYITGVNGVSCQLPPTTTINPLIGTILPAPTNDDGGCAGGFISEVLTINWAGGSVVLPNNSAPYNLCDYLVGQPYSFEYSPNINSSVTTDCGNDVAQLSIPVTESGGFITGVNGVICPVDQPPTTDITGIAGTVINITDTHGYNGGACISWISQTIDITTANGTYGPFNVENGDDLCIILSGYNTGNILDHKTIPVTITRNVTDCAGSASDTFDTNINFNQGLIKGINGITCACLELTPSMVVGGNNVCVAPYGERENVVITDASAPTANINSVLVNYEVRDQDGNIIVPLTTVIPTGSPAGSSSAPLPNILGTHRYVIIEEVTDINGCVSPYYGYNTVSLRINCLVPTPRSTDVNTAQFVECGAGGGLFSSLASMDGDTSYDLLMLEGFSGVSASQLVSQNITVTNQTTGESMSYTLTGEWQNIFYETEAQILADFPSGLNSGNTIEISGTVTFSNGCTTSVQTGTNTLP